ncbi:MAG: aromatic ring-hydroxylating dioxygenase subunit alpha [Pseudomonadota bacterium]
MWGNITKDGDLHSMGATISSDKDPRTKEPHPEKYLRRDDADYPVAHPRVLLERLAERVTGKRAQPESRAHRIPVSNYTLAQRFELELGALFHQMPQIVAHGSQIPNTGDALAYDWLGLPLVTMRDRAGKVGTFMNVCRHRGMRLLQDEGSYALKSLICPYHTWTYGLDGQLRNVPRHESFTDLELRENGLVSLPTEERHGFVWVQATPNADMDLDAHLAGLGADLDMFGLPGVSFFTQSIKRVQCNWKLIQDAFLDGYHVVRLHKNTVGGFFPDAVAESDQVGRHIRNAVARNEIREAPELGADDLDLRHHATYSYTLFPNSVLIMHPDYNSIISLFPQSANETVFVHSMLVPTARMDDERRAHYERSFQLIDAGVFEAEDIHVCVEAQRGFSSGANDTLLFGGLESAAADFHELIDEAIGSP